MLPLSLTEGNSKIMGQIMLKSFSFIVWYFSAKMRTSKVGVTCIQSIQVPGLRFEMLGLVELQSRTDYEHCM